MVMAPSPMRETSSPPRDTQGSEILRIRRCSVLAGKSVTCVAAQVGVSRQTLHKWLARYRDDGLTGLIGRSRRPISSPWQSLTEVEAAV
jgi:transposase-like protein